MFPPEFPLDEQARLLALHNLHLLDTLADERFDRLTRLARAFFGTGMATVSLVDAERLWFKSRQGLDVPEIPRDVSFCGHAILAEDVFHVTDVSQDKRFHDNPLVTGAPHIRFYAGAPIHTPNKFRIGTLCVLDQRPRQLSDAERQVLQDLAACVDDAIAEYCRQQATDVLAGQESHLRSLLNAMDDGVLTIDRAGVIRTANPAAARILGVASWVDLLGREMASLRAAGDAPPAGWETRGEHLLRRADGEEFVASLSAGPLPGAQQHRIIILRDISELKAAERAKNEFISTVSHELRTPLTSIRGSLGLLLGGALGEFPAKAARMLDVANRNALRLTQLIDDLLDLEKLSAGSMRFHVTRVAVAPALESAASANEGYALRQEVGLRITQTCEDSVQADEMRLQQVFANLISNAIKYSPRGGIVELAAEVAGDDVRFSVRDHGSGIPEEFRGRIFQPFSQADSSDVRARGGTGLGLNISRTIVESLGGSIGFDSSAAGTTFHFRLPRHAAPASVCAPPPVVKPAARTGEVLVSGCREAAGTALAELLGRAGLPCRMVAPVDAALAQLEQEGQRLLLVDMGVAGRDVFQLPAGRCRRAGAGGAHCLFFSGRRADEESAVAVLGLAAWLQEPVPPPQLRTLLEPWCAAAGGLSVLHVEDDPVYATGVGEALRPFTSYRHAPDLAEAVAALGEATYDVVLLDPGLPDGDGSSLLPRLPPESVVVLVAGAVPESLRQATTLASLRKGRPAQLPLLEALRQLAAHQGKSA